MRFIVADTPQNLLFFPQLARAASPALGILPQRTLRLKPEFQRLSLKCASTGLGMRRGSERSGQSREWKGGSRKVPEE